MTEAVRVARVRVRGRVQGVGYRAWTADVAAELALDGWVRNRTDGSVEALFADAVAMMLERCCNGPRVARVTEVSIEEEGGAPPEAGFVIARAA